MMKNYLKRSALLLGAAAFVGMAHAEYVDVTRQYIKDPTFIPEWQGTVGNVNEGVCEVWNGAFQTYQNLGEMPAGKYVLTANAFYRCGNNDYARDNQIGNPDLNTCYIFINDAKQTVAPLQDGREGAPNSMWDASQAFQADEYLNTVEYDHKGGKLVIGIRNTGCYEDEWACFDNFKLTCDGVDVPVANGDFEQGGIDAKRSWNNDPTNKVPDVQKDGSGGGVYRKCGGSPYNTGQQVTLPAGKYRFGMECFHRYGSTVDAEGNYYNHKWPLDIVEEAYGSMKRSPKDWFEANDYDQVGDELYAHAYIYMSMNETKPNSVAWSESEAEGDLNEATDVRTRVRDCWEICNGDLSIMPQNNPMCLCVDNPDYNPAYEQKNKCLYAHDSGNEREAAAAFVNEPEKWYQYVEFTLTEETTVWLGLAKDQNTGDGYWHAYANIRLEVLDGEEGGDDNVDPDTNRTPVMIDWNEDGQFSFFPDDFYCEGGVVYDEDEAAFVFDGETLGRICLDLNGKALDMSEVASIEVKGSYLNTANDVEGTFGPGAWGNDDPIQTLYIGRTLDGKFNVINEWYGSRYAISFGDFANVADKVTQFYFKGREIVETVGEGDEAVQVPTGTYVPGFSYIDEVIFTKTQEADPMGITGEWWHEWDNWDETANIVASNLAYCGVRLNETLNGGDAFAGCLNGMVPGNCYADFTQYAGIYVKGTPGTPWRGLFNRQSLEDAGDYKNVVVELNEDGEAEIIFSQIPELQGETYIHLNTVKMNWGAENCKITKFNYIEGAGIENVVVTTPYNNKMYNLQGIEVNDSYKGMVIKNGVKFFNK